MCCVASSFSKDIHTKCQANAVDSEVQDTVSNNAVGLPCFSKAKIDLVLGEWLKAIDEISKDEA